MKLWKRVFNLALCFILSLSTMARAEQLSLSLPEPTPMEQQAVINKSEYLFKKGGLAQYYLKRAKIAAGQFTLNRAHSAAIGGVQTVLVGGMSMLMISMQITCEQKKIKNEKDCLNSDVILNNFGVAAKYMVSSGEFYAGTTSGSIASMLVIDVVNYLLKNAGALSFLKKFLVGAVQSTAMFLGFSFGMQLWKESMVFLTEEEKALAHGLIPRLALSPFNGGEGQHELSANDEALFKKIVGIMTEILFSAPELRSMVIYNWWRLEVMTGKGAAAIASAIPAFMYMLHGMRTGASMGPKGFIIGGALGLMGGVAAALLPEEYTRVITLNMQEIRSWSKEQNMYVNAQELRRILQYYDHTKDSYGMVEDKFKDQMRAREFNKLLNQRSQIRDYFGTIVYERVFDAQTLIDDVEQNMLIARKILSDLELRDALARSLSVGPDGKFIYADAETEAKYGTYAMAKEGEYQRQIILMAQPKVVELKNLIKKEISSIYEFYDKESNVMGELSLGYYGKAPASLVLDISNESAKAKELKDRNKNIIYAFVIDNPKNKALHLAYLKAASDHVTLFRNHTYTENLLLQNEEPKKQQ